MAEKRLLKNDKAVLKSEVKEDVLKQLKAIKQNMMAPAREGGSINTKI